MLMYLFIYTIILGTASASTVQALPLSTNNPKPYLDKQLN